jgi:hypothetical protein
LAEPNPKITSRFIRHAKLKKRLTIVKRWAISELYLINNFDL